MKKASKHYCLLAFFLINLGNDLLSRPLRAVVLGNEDLILPEDLSDAVLEGAESQHVVIQYQQLLKETKMS
jgi:hypothetical protein